VSKKVNGGNIRRQKKTLRCGHRRLFSSPQNSRRKKHISPCPICKEIQKKQEQALIDAAVKRIGSVGKSGKSSGDVRVSSLMGICKSIQQKGANL